ncbi:MAG: PDZ domain-containing protein [bacterium]|nr:PDZ domain-containing protein [bacterium]
MAKSAKTQLILILGLLAVSGVRPAWAQYDSAIYDTFTRFSPAVYSINVQVPKTVIMAKYEESITRLRDFHDQYSDMVMGGTQPIMSYFMLDSLIDKWERQLNYLKEQMLLNNRVHGSGFAIDNHHIVTLSTVIKNATGGADVSVSDLNDNSFEAQVKGIDEMTGVAVLYIPGATFEHFIDTSRLSTQLTVSSYVMTIQSPYTLPPSPYSGMIGGYFRRLKQFPLERYIQTDLPLYPGNEGAPVLSPSGNLVGMMASEFHVGNYPSVTFVIPADLVLDSVNQILQRGEDSHAWIPGIELQQLVNRFTEAPAGILVKNIDTQSPAAASGLQPGDIIVGFQGEDERRLEGLLRHLIQSTPNQVVSLDVIRGEQRLQFQVATVSRDR